MRYVILLVIAVISFALLGTFINQNTGTVNISIGGLGTYGMNLWVFALYLFLFIIFALIIFRGLWWLISIPNNFKKYCNNHKGAKANSLLQKGMLSMGKGHWKKAEKILIKGAKLSNSAKKNSSLFLSTAAVAAQNQGADARRDQYLLQARQLKVDGVDTITSALTEARIHLNQNEPQKALDLMSQFEHSVHASNFQVLNTKIQAYNELHQFGKSFDSLYETKKYLSKKEFAEQNIEIANMAFIDKDLDINIKNRIWNTLPKLIKADDNILLGYVSSLLSVSEHEKADKIITSAISKTYSPTLISAYSQIELGSSSDKLKQVLKWLQQQPQNPYLNYDAAKFSFQSENYEDAKEYAKKSLKEKAEPEAFTLLGAIYEALGKKEAALHSYKAAVSFIYSVDNAISGEFLPVAEKVPKIKES